MLVVTAALVMAAMMVAMAMPAFVAGGCANTEAAVNNCVFVSGDSDVNAQNHLLVNPKTGTFLHQRHYNVHGTDDKNAGTCKVGLTPPTDTVCHPS
jgi:hypothetical protein